MSKRRNIKNDCDLQLSASRNKTLPRRVSYLVAFFFFCLFFRSFLVGFCSDLISICLFFESQYVFLGFLQYTPFLLNLSSLFFTTHYLLVPISPLYFYLVRLGYYFCSLTILHTKQILFPSITILFS